MKQNKKIAVGCVAALLIVLAGGSAYAVHDARKQEEAYRIQGIQAMQEEKYEDAITAFNQALDKTFGSAGAKELDICYYKAAAQYAAGYWQDAISTYDAMLSYEEENAQAYFLRGSVYLEQEETEKAMLDYDKAAEYTTDYEMFLKIYDNLKAHDMEEEAAGYLKKGIAYTTDKTAENQTLKGRMYMLLEEDENALNVLQGALAAGDSNAALYLSKVYQSQGDSERADEMLSQYIDKNKESSVAYNAIGCEAMEQGKYQDALTAFQSGLAAEEVTNEQELRRNSIAAYEYLGDYATAKTEMERYLADYPMDEEAQREALFLQSR